MMGGLGSTGGGTGSPGGVPGGDPGGVTGGGFAAVIGASSDSDLTQAERANVSARINSNTLVRFPLLLDE